MRRQQGRIYCVDDGDAGFRSIIQAAGIAEHDPRIAHTMEQVKLQEAARAADAHLTLEEFSEIVRPDLRMMCAPETLAAHVSLSNPVDIGAQP